MAKIESGNWIKASYEGTLKDGAKFDASENFVFQVDTGMVIKGFDSNVLGMEEGEEKSFTISSVEAYGEISDDKKEQVPLDFFKGIEKVDIGMEFMAQTPMGPLKVKVLTIDEAAKTAEVSLNHPLAGEDLTFKLKVEKVLGEEEAKIEQEKIKKMQEEAMKAQIEAMQKTQAAASESCSSEGCASCNSGCYDEFCDSSKEPSTEDKKEE